MLRHCRMDHPYMANTLADFPPHQFAITAYCQCGYRAHVDYRQLPPEMLVSSLRTRLVCQVCGQHNPGIRIHWSAAGGFKYSSG